MARLVFEQPQAQQALPGPFSEAGSWQTLGPRFGSSRFSALPIRLSRFDPWHAEGSRAGRVILRSDTS